MKYTIQRQKPICRACSKKRLPAKEVIIVRGNEPMAKLVPIRKARKKRQAGSMTGKITCSADAFAPLTDKELSDLGFE